MFGRQGNYVEAGAPCISSTRDVFEQVNRQKNNAYAFVKQFEHLFEFNTNDFGLYFNDAEEMAINSAYGKASILVRTLQRAVNDLANKLAEEEQRAKAK